LDTGFSGEFDGKVDGKGRMSIPADFRRVLEAGDPNWTSGNPVTLYLNYGDHLKDRLQVRTATEHANIMADIQAMPKGDKARKMLTQLVIVQSERMSVDKDGRIVLPLKHRKKLGLDEGPLSFRGMVDHFEIWKDDVYETTVSESTAAWLAEQDDDFDPLSLLGG
jgi:MraZ protein